MYGGLYEKAFTCILTVRRPRMKKRLLASLLSAVLGLSLLAGCSGGQDNNGGSASDNGAAETETAEKEEEPELTKITLNEVAHSIYVCCH